jgi:outer membrane autotransporter protein
VSSDDNLGAASGGLTFDGGALRITGTSFQSTARGITWGPAGGGFDIADAANVFTVGQALSGPGGLLKAGVGTLVLTGANGYTGGTTITAGILQLGDGGTSGSILGDVLNNGTFAINRSDTYTFGGLISGTGSLTQAGTGATILVGANTYTGGTTISAGTLQLGNGGTSGSILGDVLNNGTFAINRSDTYTFGGVISGPGSFVQMGPGTTVLTGSNTYSGGTTVNAGTLQLGPGGNLAPTGALTVNAGGTFNLNGFNQMVGDLFGSGLITLGSGTLAAGTANSTIFAGAISGTGGFVKQGTGTLMFTGASTYTGDTSINAGALVVNGSIANSAVTVNNGGALAGTGTVGATTINSGGIFAPGPGGTPGSMTVAGNLAFQSGALYLVQVNPSNASSANVTLGGSATLAGTVQAAFASGTYASRTYTILRTAGGLAGTTFNALTTTNLPAGFTPSLSYSNTEVILNLTAALGTGGLSGNQRNVAGALNNFFNNGGALPPNFVTIFGLTGANLGNALTSLSGEAATGAQQAAFQMGNQFLGLMLDPFVDGRSGVAGAGGPALGFAPEQEALPDDIALAYSKVLKAPQAATAPTFDQRWTAWGGAYGGGNKTSGDPAVLGSHDLTANTAGFAGGLDYRLTPNSVVGFALAGGGTSWSLAQGLGGGKSDAFQAGVYGATRWGAAYLAGAFAYTNHWMSTDRFAFAGDHLTASFNAQSLGGRVEGGYRFATFYGGITPYAAIQAQSFRTPGYSEIDGSGAGFALAYNARTGTDTRSELGARFDRLIALNPAAALALRGRLAWAHDWVSDPTLAALFQTLPGASFIVNGALPAKDSALVSAGTELRLANGVTLLGKFDGELAAHASTYAGTGTVRYAW